MRKCHLNDAKQFMSTQGLHRLVCKHVLLDTKFSKLQVQEIERANRGLSSSVSKCMAWCVESHTHQTPSLLNDSTVSILRRGKHGFFQTSCGHPDSGHRKLPGSNPTSDTNFLCPKKGNFLGIWVCLKIWYIPNEIAI